MFDRYLTFFKLHERALLILTTLVVILYLGRLWINHSADKADAASVAAQQVLTQQVEVNKQLAAQVGQQQVAYASLSKVLGQQIAGLQSQIIARNQALAVQQVADEKLPLDDLAVRWRSLINVMPADIQITDSAAVVSPAAARKTTEQLEEVAPLHDEVMAGHQIEDKLTQQLNACTSLDATKDREISGLGIQLADKDKACSAEVSKVKADSRKSKLKWFVGGIVGGLVTALKFGL